MKNKNKIIFLILGIVIGVIITLVGVALFKSGNDGEVHLEKEGELTEKHKDEEHSAGIVSLTSSEMKELGIVLSKVEPKKLQMHIDLTGEIVPDPDNVAHIVPRFAGIVKSVAKKIGDRVTKDEVIAVIESNESLVTYDVKSLIDGVILELHMTPGELIGDEQHIVTIANLNSVWAELNVYQKDLTKIKTGQTAQVYFDEIENAVERKIFYISPTVDEHTRTTTARVRLNNAKGFWKPGMFITAKVLTDLVEVEQAVTLSAIQNFEGQKVVFVQEDDGFRPRQITIGKTNTEYAEVLSGLNSGQAYIAEGAFVIKSELIKESFGGDEH